MGYVLSGKHKVLFDHAEERLAGLALIRSRRVGPVTFYRLMAEYGSAARALAALPDIARAAGAPSYLPCSREMAAQEMAKGHEMGAQLVGMGDPLYPPLLAQLDDAPPFFWLLGDGDLLMRPMVALVGARNASSLGLRMAQRLAEGLAEAGFVVVSGLARGIDAKAHEAALAGGTLAVVAGGLDIIYPSENIALAKQIAAHGCLLSEQPFGIEPQARHFPLRNRIISGLSQAVVVVEAALRSGSLITAKEAAEQGRDVLAVPGHPFDARAAGCNQLIRDGAVLVRSAADVIEAVGQLAKPVFRMQAVEPKERAAKQPEPLAAAPDDVKGMILEKLGPSPVAEDQLVRDLGLNVADIAPHLLQLELEGKVQRHAGGMLSLG